MELKINSRNTTTIPKSKSAEDPFYRYRRALAQVSFINKHGGSTCWTNAAQVAKDLNRSLERIIHFLQMKNGCRLRLVNIEQVLFQGQSVSSPDLESWMEEYIAKYVLCAHCGNPETKHRKTSKKTARENLASVERLCRACGKESK